MDMFLSLTFKKDKGEQIRKDYKLAVGTFRFLYRLIGYLLPFTSW
jgi:hypothetical protein